MSPNRILQIISTHARPLRAAQVLRLLTRLAGREHAADFQERLRNEMKGLNRIEQDTAAADSELCGFKIAVLSVKDAVPEEGDTDCQELCGILNDCVETRHHPIAIGFAGPDLRPVLAQEPDCILLAGRAAAGAFASNDLGHVPYLLSCETSEAAHRMLTPPALTRSSIAEVDRVRQLLWDAEEVFAVDREMQMAIAPSARSVRIVDQYASRMSRADVIQRMYAPILSELQRNLSEQRWPMALNR